jgi:predicted DNA-binding transcriptional regulator AlpA
MVESRLLSLREAARYISHSPKWLYTRTGKRGKEGLPFRAIKIGSRVYFDRRALDAWIDELTAMETTHGRSETES